MRTPSNHPEVREAYNAAYRTAIRLGMPQADAREHAGGQAERKVRELVRCIGYSRVVDRDRLPRWWTAVGDGEWGFLTIDELESCPHCEHMPDPIDHDDPRCRTCDHRRWIAGWSGDGAVPNYPVLAEPARCSICEGELAHDAPEPLCSRHGRIGRVHGRLDAERTRQERMEAASGAAR